MTSLQWRHNERDSASNHQPRDCLLNRLFRRRSKKTSKLRVTGLCAGNSPGTDFPAQMVSNAEKVSIWWRHHNNHPASRRCHRLIMAGSIRHFPPNFNYRDILTWDDQLRTSHSTKQKQNREDILKICRIAIIAKRYHYDDAMMSAMASQITSLTIVYSTVNSDADQRKHQSSSSLAFVRGIQRWPVNSPQKWTLSRKRFPFDDVIIIILRRVAATDWSWLVVYDIFLQTSAIVIFWHGMTN